jgi:hypothetical protein
LLKQPDKHEVTMVAGWRRAKLCDLGKNSAESGEHAWPRHALYAPGSGVGILERTATHKSAPRCALGRAVKTTARWKVRPPLRSATFGRGNRGSRIPTLPYLPSKLPSWFRGNPSRGFMSGPAPMLCIGVTAATRFAVGRRQCDRLAR